MPELPDVEGFRRVLADCAQGRTIQRIEVRDTGVLHGVSPDNCATRWKAAGSACPSGAASGCSPAPAAPLCSCTSA